MGSKRIVLNSNNLWLLPWSDRIIGVMDPGRDLNTHDVPRNIEDWQQLGLVGSNARSTHHELEVFGVVISGKKLEELSTELINHQCITNREGFLIMYFNIGAGNMYLKKQSSVMRRLNDVFDWSKYGVNVPTPVETEWDRFQLGTGKLKVDYKVDGKKVEELSKLLAEKEKENQKLKEQLNGQDDESISLAELLKEKDELIQRQNKDLEERDNEIDEINKVFKEKEKEIADLKSKLDANGGNADELQKLRNELAAKENHKKMATSRLVLTSNTQWLRPISDMTIRVLDSGRDLNIHNLDALEIHESKWNQTGRVGTAGSATHRELEVFGVVISGKKLEDLCKELINHQVIVTREGFMFTHLIVGAKSFYLNHQGKSHIRRLNDLFDWSKYGVNVPTPLETVWDRFQLNTGKLMVDNRGAAQKDKENQDKEKENQKLKEQLEEEKNKNEQQQKEKDELIEQQKKELEDKDKQLAAKDKQIASLRAALQAFI
ncbi:hypothetical protein LINPERPRIM_LOCUS2278 [Linum perenne]